MNLNSNKPGFGCYTHGHGGDSSGPSSPIIWCIHCLPILHWTTPRCPGACRWLQVEWNITQALPRWWCMCIYIYNYTSCNCRDHNSNSESCYNVLTFFLSGGSPPTIVCIVKEQQVIHAHMVECERLTQVINGQKNHSKTRAAMIPTDSSPATTPTTVPVSNCKQ